MDLVDASQKIVMPGLVDCHNHVGEAHMFHVFGWLVSPLTGIVDTAIRILWPSYNRLTDESVYDLTLLGLVNMLKHGTTTYANAFPFRDAVYRASAFAKMRTVIHMQMITSVNLPDARNEAEYLALSERAIRDYHNTQDGLIQMARMLLLLTSKFPASAS